MRPLTPLRQTRSSKSFEKSIQSLRKRMYKKHTQFLAALHESASKKQLRFKIDLQCFAKISSRRLQLTKLCQQTRQMLPSRTCKIISWDYGNSEPHLWISEHLSHQGLNSNRTPCSSTTRGAARGRRDFALCLCASFKLKPCWLECLQINNHGNKIIRRFPKQRASQPCHTMRGAY